jgi:hypothetical protein
MQTGQDVPAGASDRSGFPQRLQRCGSPMFEAPEQTMRVVYLEETKKMREVTRKVRLKPDSQVGQTSA